MINICLFILEDLFPTFSEDNQASLWLFDKNNQIKE